MAYLPFAEGAGGVAARPLLAPLPPVIEPAELTALEWSIVDIARRDRLSTLRERGRGSRVARLLFGERPNPRLADPRLEAVRRIAVLSWHHGYTVPSVEVKAFLAAGYSTDQYELIVDHIADARSTAATRRSQA